MPAIGQTVKKIRQIKGFTQKEVYSTIVSRSFANRFERGLNDVSATKLFQILDNLSISLDEFRFIHNNYQQTKVQALQDQLIHAYEAHNLQIMGKIVADYKTSRDLGLRSVAATGEILIEAYHSKTVSMTPEINNLWDQLAAAKTWTIREIKLADVLFVIAVSTGQVALIPKIFAKFETNCLKYLPNGHDPFNLSDELMNMYLTVFQIQLNLTHFEQAKQLAKKVGAIDAHLLTANGRICQQLIVGIANLYFGNEEAGQRILRAIEQFEALYTPAIDHNVIGIIQIRKKWAKKYRRQQAK
ncbi:transcriptional regulator [Lentilactobacillus fungorum]|uniref:Transcriptional regulator n=1 Tax=Lentilactobacillus fungorum TaxID=2201250 RepID=A0ABQ3W3G8_9LACO|nr:Rgg/GadR/MutR family transcriptional regulator [Lentilactobacillus fungorum]GHP15044.1 transcriptional regulator [Lentilactobacillus fungorum]